MLVFGLATEAGFPASRMESLNSGYLESSFYMSPRRTLNMVSHTCRREWLQAFIKSI